MIIERKMIVSVYLNIYGNQVYRMFSNHKLATKIQKPRDF